MKNLVRKLVCLLLAAVMMFSAVCALAEAPTISNVKDGDGSWSAPYDHSVWKPLVSFDLNTSANVSSTIYDQNGNAFNTPKINGVSADNAAVSAGNIVLDWPAVNYDGWHMEPGNYDFSVDITAKNGDGSDQYTYNFNFRFVHGMADHVQDEPVEEVWIPETLYYAHNTVCSFGPQFRDITPELTDKWYMFTALDLSQDGTQSYELIGGNAYVIGRAYVTVEGDSVTVDYEYVNDDVWAFNDFFTFFADYDSVTTVEPAQIDSPYTYGQTYSIQNDLNGDTDVLLFMCNEVTFKDDNKQIVRYYKNNPDRKALRQQMLDMIGKTMIEE